MICWLGVCARLAAVPWPLLQRHFWEQLTRLEVLLILPMVLEEAGSGHL